MDWIQKKLFSLQDEKYREFTAGLLPGIDRSRIIGVRLPALRKLAKEVVACGLAEDYLRELPHEYLEEDHLHSFIIDESSRNYEQALQRTSAFLPFVDNWAVCDSLRPMALRKDLPALYEQIKVWMSAEEPYTVRFSLVLQLHWYLGEEFREEMLSAVAEIKSEDYYVNMAAAWYFSMALVKQYGAAIPFFQERRLGPWIHNKALQKAIESRQLDDETKSRLRKLKYREPLALKGKEI